MKEFINKNGKVILILLIVILLSIIGFTLAYDANDILVNLTSGNYNVVYSGTATLPSANLNPINDSELLSSGNINNIMKIDFTVKGAQNNPTGKPIIYDVSLTNLDLPNELRSEYLKWRLYKNGTQISEGSFSPDFDVIANNRMVLTNTQQDLPSYSSTADSYTFYIWISDPCTGDITTCTDTSQDQSSLVNKTFSGEIRIELSTGSKKELVRPKAANKLVMALANTDTTACAEGGTGVCKTEHTLSDGSIATDYRYRGADPNNYVSFNNDLYRIIGVFDDNTHGVEGEYLIKLIMADKLYAGSWGNYSTLADIASGTYSSYGNDWTGNKIVTDDSDNTSPANINILLNEFFYNKTNTSGTYGSCSNWTFYSNSDNYKTFSCSDIVGHGLDDTYRNYVQEATWHLRGYTANSNTKQNFYLCERGQSTDTTCMSGNSDTYDKETTGNIGLMYVSDYLYASSYKSDTDTSLTGSSKELGNKNWLYKGFEWTITPDADSADYAFIVYDRGSVTTTGAYNGRGVRPTFYLKSTTGITGGEGTLEKPYILS